MMQIKVFYHISFPEDRFEVITTDESENKVANCDDLIAGS